jgi:serine/threonine protein kinase
MGSFAPFGAVPAEASAARRTTMNEETLFHRARAKPPAERAAFLEEACGGDAALRERVEALLRAHDSPGSFLARPAVEVPTTGPAAAAASPDVGGPRPGAEGPGSRVGPYTLLQQLGEGGMGTVFLAEQAHPVHRRVALKVIKPGLDNAQVLARFEAERQALALMDHPHIAKVLDADATEGGRPYFVMELVHGVPITGYCDDHRLTPRERLALFLPVCQAVQHAHQKGVIHRDLKPSNVLVALYDGSPAPKIIDFGVAKATGPKLTERTLYTEFGAVVGTLEYMSPEQAELNQLDIDTRSDIYSLGVMLYELLTGTTPLDRKRLPGTSLLELLRIIREEEPPKPSARLSATADLPAIAANRGAEPARLRRLVQGELDWIVMTALEKDRARRYQTPGSLAQDVQRYLNDEPVLACPPSAPYRFRKFVRRNRRSVGMVLAIVLALLVSLVWVWQERKEALRQRDLAQEQRRESESNRRKAHQAVNDYFTLVSENTLLSQPDLEPLRDQLLRAALRYYQDFVAQHNDDPELQAELAATHFRIALLTHDLNEDNDWLPPMQECFAILADLLRRKSDPAAFLSLRNGIFRVNTAPHGASVVGARAPGEVCRTLEEGQEIWEELVRADPAAPGYRNDLAAITNVLAASYLHAGRPEDALRCLRQSQDLWGRLVQESPAAPHYRAAYAMCLMDLSWFLTTLGQPDLSDGPQRAAVEAAEKLLADFPGVPAWREFTSVSVHGLRAQLLERRGRVGEAEVAYRAALAGQEALMRDYPTVARYRRAVLRTRLGLADLLWAAARPADAARPYGDAHSLGDMLKPDDPEAYAAYAWFLATCPDPKFRDPQRAVGMARQLVNQLPQVAAHWLLLGAGLYGAGDYGAAVPALERETQLPTGQTSTAALYLAMAHWRLGHREEARDWYQRAVTRMEQNELAGEGDPRLRAEAAKLLGTTKE